MGVLCFKKYDFSVDKELQSIFHSFLMNFFENMSEAWYRLVAKDAKGIQ